MLTNLEKYFSYKGTGQRPKDFDEFWDKGKQQVDKLGTEYQLVKTDGTIKYCKFLSLIFYRY